MIIGDERPLTVDNKFLVREVILEKAPNGKKNMRIILKPRTLGGQEGSSSSDQSVVRLRPVRPVSPTGQTGPDGRSDRPGGQPRTFKPKHPEVGTWKTNQPKVQGKIANQKPTFGQLLNMYSKAVRNDQPLKKRPRSPPCQGAPSSPRGESSKRRGDVVTLFPQQMQPMYATMSWAPPASDS